MYVCESERKVLFKEQRGNRDVRGQTCHNVQTRVIFYMQKANSCHTVVCHYLCYGLTCCCLYFQSAEAYVLAARPTVVMIVN